MTVNVYRARRVVTLDPANPDSTAVAVRDGRFLHVGRYDDVVDWVSSDEWTSDDRFADAVIVPGFIEAHGHLSADGAFAAQTYVGFDDRRRPDGAVARGCRSLEEVVRRLAEAARESEGPLLAVGFDPSFHDGRALDRHLLDAASTEVPITVLNASGHLAYANGVQMARRGVSASTDARGVVRDSAGEPTGEFHETAMALVVDASIFLGQGATDGPRAGALMAARAGVTTASDLALFAAGESFEQYGEAARSIDFPVRVTYSPFLSQMASLIGTDDLLQSFSAMRTSSTDRFTLGPLKLIVDGSIQGYTAKLGWPGYCNGHDEHAFLLLDVAKIVDIAGPFHAAGYQLALHTNGDEATEVALDAIERLLEDRYRPDHGHRLEHCQMATPAQFARMRRLGVGANLFANHVYYWGDIHAARTMGPDRARRMDAAATALAEGVTISLHSDHPVTPVDPLFTMWCATTRTTRSGTTLGAHERISVDSALRAVTLGAARLMRRDHELGSIEVGKLADMTVLDRDPLMTPAEDLRSIGVLGTVVGGVPVSL